MSQATPRGRVATPPFAHWRLHLLFCLLIMLPFASTFVMDFGIQNDYSIFSYDNHKCCLGYPETEHLFWIGRPIGAILLNVSMMPLSTIQDFALGRVVAALTLCLLWLLIFRIFNRNTDQPPIVSAVAAFTIVLLPSALVYTIWLTNYVPGLFNLIIVTAAFDLVDRSYDRGTKWQAGVGYLLFLLSFFIYPPTSYFFLTFTAWRALMSPAFRESRWQMRTLVEIAMTGVLSAIYFVIVKLTPAAPILGLFPQGVGPLKGSYTVELTHDIISRLPLVGDYLVSSALVWSLDRSLFSTLPTVLAFLALAVLAARRFNAGTRPEKIAACGMMLVPIGCGLVSGVPVFVATSGFVVLRVLFATSSIVAIVIVAAIVHFTSATNARRLGEAMLSALGVAVVFSASIWVSAAATNAHDELTFLRTRFASAPPVIRSVLINQPPERDTIVNKALLPLELGYLGTNYFLVDGLVRGVLKERGLPYREVAIAGVRGVALQGATLVPDAVEIDMAQAGFRQAALEAGTPSEAISTTSTAGCCSAVLAFVGQPHEFWESVSGFPVSLDVKFPNTCQRFSSYQITAPQDLIERAPTAWRMFRRTKDDPELKLVEERTLDSSWKAGQSKLFSFPNTNECNSEIQFEFLRSGDPRILRIGKIEFRP